MNLRTRILTLTSSLIASVVLLTAAVLAWNARESLLAEQQSNGEVVARMLARAGFIVSRLPDQVELGIGDRLVVEATLTAQFVAAAEAAGWSPEEINQHLKEISASSTLGEIRVTDEQGRVYLSNLDDALGSTFTRGSADPRFSMFVQLLGGSNRVVILPAQARDDGKFYKYVGISGIDKNRIVQIGYNAEAIQLVRESVSMDSLGKELIASRDISAIRIINKNAETEVFQSNGIVSQVLSPTDLAIAKQVMTDGKVQTYIDEDLLKVVQPINTIDAYGKLSTITNGAVIIFLPTDRLRAAVLYQLTQAIIVAFVILVFGVIVSLILARTITRPIDSFREAATSVQSGDYQPELLERVLKRPDELGRLGKVFDQMAREMGARDRRLRLLQVIIPLGVALSAEKDFSRLLETIVIEALKIAHADAGSLYLLDEGNLLKFVIMRNETLGTALGGTTGKDITLQPVPLYDEEGRPNHNHIVSYCALTGKHVWLDDAYSTTEFDLSGTRAFDAQTGYHTTSVLTMSLKDASNNIIGALQLINAMDPKTHEVVPFEQDEVVDSLALITSAALSAYIREESLREEINKLRIEIDYSRQTKQVKEIVESDYFKALQSQADAMRKKRKSGTE